MTPRSIPAGSSVTLQTASLPPAPPLVAALRRFVQQEEAVAATYVFGLAVDDAPPQDVVGVDLQAGGSDEGVLTRLESVLQRVAPRDVTIDLAVLSDEARLAALHVCAPIGAGGALEMAAARAAHDPAAVVDLLQRLIDATLYVPALDETTTEPPGPRQLAPGEPVRYPITRIGGYDAIAVFSSWWALLHADPPFPDQIEAGGRSLLQTWPQAAALALDPGCLHAVVLPPEDCTKLREAGRSA
ncbi:MAG: SseB family protein [Actinomycetota bacterium]|nr:SseB family protein [Actinomycetota bacterium]